MGLHAHQETWDGEWWKGVIARIWKERGSRESLLGQSCDLQLLVTVLPEPIPGGGCVGFQSGKSMISSWVGQQFPVGMANGFHLVWPMVSSWVDQWGAPARNQMVEGGYYWNIYFQVHITQLPHPIPCQPLRLRAGWKKVAQDLERWMEDASLE